MLKKIELDYSLLISKFKKGINIQKYLEKNSNLSSGDIVRISSDIQSGSYIKNYKKDYIDLQKKLFSPMINIINSRFSNCNSMLDFGCGELTNSLFFIKNIDSLKKFYACDVSFNRLVLGKYFLKDKLSNKQFNKVNLFCSPISKLPFNDNSIDLIITTHAIESNQKNKKNIIKELFRVSKNGLLLFEPHYEKSSYSQKKRMNFYNYAKGLEKIIKQLDCNLEIIPMKYYANKMNKTSVFIVEKKKKNFKYKECMYTDIDSKSILKKYKNYLYSKNTSRVFPILEEIALFSEQTNLYLPNKIK